MPKSLAEAKTKFTLLTAAPADPKSPTAAELNAGMDISCRVLLSSFSFGADASDTVEEKTLCTQGSGQSLGSGNHHCEFDLFRFFKNGTAESENDAGADDAFQAIKTKGTEVYFYARKGDKEASVDWAAKDEIFLGMRAIMDTPQQTDIDGYIKTHHLALPQDAWDYITVGGGTTKPSSGSGS